MEDDEQVPKCLSLDADDKGVLSTTSRDAFFAQLKSIHTNFACFDCGSRNPTWVSVSFGIFLCLDCSGHHRNMGARISFVRSLELDQIRIDEALRMELGGNAKAKTFFQANGCVGNAKVDYKSRSADRYRKLLESEANTVLGEYCPNLKLIASSEGSEMVAPSVSPQRVSLINGDAPSRGGGIDGAAVMGFGATTRTPVVKAKADDFDFDFDSAFASGAAAPAVKSGPVLTGGLVPKPVLDTVPETSARQTYRPKAVPTGLVGYGGKDLSKARGISGADFAPPADDVLPTMNAARFKNAQAISSDAYFGHENSERNNNWTDDEMATRLAIIREGAIQKAFEVANVASETFKSAANWFSKVTSSPSYI